MDIPTRERYMGLLRVSDTLLLPYYEINGLARLRRRVVLPPHLVPAGETIYHLLQYKIAPNVRGSDRAGLLAGLAHDHDLSPEEWADILGNIPVHYGVPVLPPLDEALPMVGEGSQALADLDNANAVLEGVPVAEQENYAVPNEGIPRLRPMMLKRRNIKLSVLRTMKRWGSLKLNKIKLTVLWTMKRGGALKLSNFTTMKRSGELRMCNIKLNVLRPQQVLLICYTLTFQATKSK
uniref:Uncharacterized protein n=1 Tax=Leersia perrieri TaxID=77586 RepID=A0A0D9XSW1_9ORYZ